jgi:hypothetical protein
MAQRRHFNQRKQKPARGAPRYSAPAAPRVPLERKPPVTYGKPFVVLEDAEKNTFEYAQGAWVPYAMSIAECRHDCQVKELPQKVNGKTRYEVRLPLES